MCIRDRVKDAPEEEDSLFGDLLVDEEDEIDLGNTATASTGYLDNEPNGNSGTFGAGDLVVEDDDEEDDPFGFGSMLSGGKKF